MAARKKSEYCPACGAYVPSGEKTCVSCGCDISSGKLANELLLNIVTANNIENAYIKETAKYGIFSAGQEVQIVVTIAGTVKNNTINQN